MAIKRNLTIIAKDGSGDIVQRNVPFVNPEASLENLDKFSRALNGLTTNTYSDTLVVDTRSLNEELE